MILTTNRQSLIAATALVVVAILVVFDPLPEPALTIARSIFFWPAAIWLAWMAWTRRDRFKTRSSGAGRSILAPIAIVACIAGVLALARWLSVTTGAAS